MFVLAFPSASFPSFAANEVLASPAVIIAGSRGALALTCRLGFSSVSFLGSHCPLCPVLDAGPRPERASCRGFTGRSAVVRSLDTTSGGPDQSFPGPDRPGAGCPIRGRQSGCLFRQTHCVRMRAWPERTTRSATAGGDEKHGVCA